MPANNDLFFRPLKSDRIEDVTFGFRAKVFGCVVYRIRTLALKKPENVRPIPPFRIGRVALRSPSGVSKKQPGELIGIDSTTLTRQWACCATRMAERRPETDQRTLRLALTKAGEKEYSKLRSSWPRPSSGQ